MAVLYGAPGVPCFAPFHQMLAAQSAVTYVLRPYLGTGCGEGACASYGASDDNLPLAGYGVKLDIKNMEYKAMNDEELKVEEQMEQREGEVHTHSYAHSFIHSLMHTYTLTHSHTHTYKHSFIHTLMHTHTHSYTHTHSHTHTHTGGWRGGGGGD